MGERRKADGRCKTEGYPIRPFPLHFTGDILRLSHAYRINFLTESPPRLKRIEGLRAMIPMLSSFAEVLATPSASPLVLGGQFLMMTTLTDKVVYLLFVLCYSLCIFDWLIKRHPDI